MMKEILARLDSLPNNLEPITIQAKRYAENNSNIDDNVINILHRPWIAPLNWGIMIFNKAQNVWIEEFVNKTGKYIPQSYKEFLSHINGGFIYDMSLYGLPLSFYKNKLANRTNLECHNLITANNSWINKFDVNQKLFHFGSRTFTYEENIGYFYEDNKISSYRKNGELVKKWTTFGEFLFDEVYVVEQMMLEEVPEGFELKIVN